jgi:hypothetical protein
MSPRELLATHTSRDLTEWQAYFSVLNAQSRSAGPAAQGPEEGLAQLNAVFDRRGA